MLYYDDDGDDNFEDETDDDEFTEPEAKNETDIDDSDDDY